MSTITTTATTTTAVHILDGSAYKEKILDNFPVSELEVERFLLLFQAFQEKPEAPLSQLCRQASTNSGDTSSDDTDKWLSQLEDVETAFLPDLRHSIDQASQSVTPLLPYDIPDDRREPLCQLFYFLEAIVSLLGRRGTRFWTGFVYDRALETQPSESHSSSHAGADPKVLLEIIYRHLLAALHLTNGTNNRQQQSPKPTLEPPKAWVASLLHSAAKSNTNNATATTSTISRPAFTTWINNVMPESTRGFSTLFHHVLFPPQQPYGPSSPPPFVLPTLDQESSFWTTATTTTTTTPLLPLSLACISPVLNGPWYRLYSSLDDGFSFFSFENKLLSYKGPTILLVRPKNTTQDNNNNNAFGYYTECPWQNSTHTWFGGGGDAYYDSFLFQLSPLLQVYWPTWQQHHQQDNTNPTIMYLNSSPPTSVGLKGLAIGGISKDTPRVHLTLNLEQCKAAATDTMYESGPLLGDEESLQSFFEVDALEVWAVHVASPEEYQRNLALGKQSSDRKEDARRRAAQVDRTQFLDDFQSGAFMNNLYAHRDESRGRHDFVASSEQGMGYFLEGKQPSEEVLSHHHHHDHDQPKTSSGKEKEQK